METPKPDREYVHDALCRHFAPVPPAQIVTVSREYPARMRADLQRALDAAFKARDDFTFMGVYSRQHHDTITIAALLDGDFNPALIAPLRYEEVDIGEAESVRCLETGLWLVGRAAAETRCAIFLSPYYRDGYKVGWHLEVAVLPGATGHAAAAVFFKNIDRTLGEAHSYRGKILSLEPDPMYAGQAIGIYVHRYSPMAVDELVLPPSTIALLARNVIGFAAQRRRLGAMGLPQKKGLLFYGPPGTGKSYTIRYLAARIPSETVLLMSAEQIGLIHEYATLARLLQPSILVIEDADLVARERRRIGDIGDEAILNRLLNEMDSLPEDAQVLFILTTNRPQLIEAAVAGHPGRIDQAIEFPLPNAEGRLRLARLYGRGVPIADKTLQAIAARTEGVSAAFVKALMRRAIQFYVERGGADNLSINDVEAALAEMLPISSGLNIALLGGKANEGAAPAPSADPGARTATAESK